MGGAVCETQAPPPRGVRAPPASLLGGPARTQGHRFSQGRRVEMLGRVLSAAAVPPPPQCPPRLLGGPRRVCPGTAQPARGAWARLALGTAHGAAARALTALFLPAELGASGLRQRLLRKCPAPPARPVPSRAPGVALADGSWPGEGVARGWGWGRSGGRFRESGVLSSIPWTWGSWTWSSRPPPSRPHPLARLAREARTRGEACGAGPSSPARPQGVALPPPGLPSQYTSPTADQQTRGSCRFTAPRAPWGPGGGAPPPP